MKVEMIAVINGKPVTIIAEGEDHYAVLAAVEAKDYLDGFSPADGCEVRLFRHGMMGIFKKPIVVADKPPGIIIPGAFGGGARAN